VAWQTEAKQALGIGGRAGVVILAFTRLLGRWSFSRYLAVGGGLFLIDFAVFMALVRLFSVDLRVAQAISRSVGAAVGFLGHRYITFQARNNGDGRGTLVARQGMLYIAVTVINIAISPFALQFVVRVVTDVLSLAKIITEAFIVCETYVLLRLVFSPKGNRIQ
jgi:putative flippase GtrA